MFSTISSIAAMLALASANPITGYPASKCANPPASFQIYSNVTGLYGQLGGPCYDWGCAVFFSAAKVNATTYYSIKPNGNLAISPESTSNPSTDIAGHIAYTWLPANPPGYVLFGRPAKIAGNSSTTTPHCSIEDSPDGDGTCNLVCYRPNYSGDYVLLDNYDEWSFGEGSSGFAAIQVKVEC